MTIWSIKNKVYRIKCFWILHIFKDGFGGIWIFDDAVKTPIKTNFLREIFLDNIPREV